VVWAWPEKPDTCPGGNGPGGQIHGAEFLPDGSVFYTHGRSDHAGVKSEDCGQDT
jgi:hypothetical protein